MFLLPLESVPPACVCYLHETVLASYQGSYYLDHCRYDHKSHWTQAYGPVFSQANTWDNSQWYARHPCRGRRAAYHLYECMDRKLLSSQPS